MNSKRPSPSVLANIKAVAFDAYGTIIDFNEPDFIVAMEEICRRQGLAVDGATLWRHFLRTALALRSRNGGRPPYRRYQDGWPLLFGRSFQRLRLKGDPEAASVYLREKLAVALAYPEAYQVIEALRSHFRLALLSNADDDFLLACLKHNDLHFDTIVSSEVAGAMKPDTAIFQHLAQTLGLEPSSILYVGDSPLPDIMGAHRAGLPVAWINRFKQRRPRKVPPPTVKVSTLYELLPLLGLGHA